MIVFAEDAPGGKPSEPGTYVAYIDGIVSTWAERKLLQFHEGKWWYRMSAEQYRGHIYGWIGPLPAMPLED